MSWDKKRPDNHVTQLHGPTLLGCTQSFPIVLPFNFCMKVLYINAMIIETIDYLQQIPLSSLVDF